MQFKNKKSKQNTQNTQNTEEKNLKIEDIDLLSAKLDEKMSSSSNSVPKKATINESSEKKDRKKNYSIFLSEKIIYELEDFLKEFGEFGESRSSFVENAISEAIKQRKMEMKKTLLDKINKLEN